MAELGNNSQNESQYRTVTNQFYDFGYGYDEKAGVKTLLIVKELDLKHVREYDLEDDINYYCIGCLKKERFNKNYAYFDEDGFLLAPLNHQCDLIPIEVSNQYQAAQQSKEAAAKKVVTPSKSSTTASEVVVLDPPSVEEVHPSPPSPTSAAVTTDPGENDHRGFDVPADYGSSPEYVPAASPAETLSSSPAVLNVDVSTPQDSNTHAESSASPPEVVTVISPKSGNAALPKAPVISSSTNAASNHNISISNGNVFVGDKLIKAEPDRSEFEDAIVATPSPTASTVTEAKGPTPSRASRNPGNGKNDEDYISNNTNKYLWGYSSTGVENHRLIVFEPHDASLVRQYSKVNKRAYWYCIECFRITRRHNTGHFKGDVFMTPKAHSCQPFGYDFAKKQQQEIIQKHGLDEENDDVNDDDDEEVDHRNVTEVTEGGADDSMVNVNADTSARSLRKRNERGKAVAGQRSRHYSDEFDDGDETMEDSMMEDAPASSHKSSTVSITNFKFAYSAKSGNPQGRLIATEPNDPNLCRQYAWNRCNFWFCIECYRNTKKKIGGKIVNDVFMAPGAEAHQCQPISMELAEAEQDEISKKFGIDKVRASDRIQNRKVSVAIDESEAEEEFADAEEEEEKHTPTPRNYSYRTRAVYPSEYEYGVGNSGQPNYKLFVFEEGNRNQIRMYGRNDVRRWYCCGCLKLKKQMYGSLKDEIFYAPLAHICSPSDYETVMQTQESLKKRYKNVNTRWSNASTAASSARHSLGGANPTKSENGPMLVQQGGPSKSTFKPVFNKQAKLRDLASNTPPISVDNQSSYVQEDESFSRSPTPPPVPVQYREMDRDRWEFGYDSFGNERKRIIVRDCDDLSLAHEYRNDKSDHRCLGCQKHGKVALKFYKGTLYAPALKDHSCSPRNYDEIMTLQHEYMKNGGRKRGRTVFSVENVDKKRQKIAQPKDTESSISPDLGDYMDTSDVKYSPPLVYKPKPTNVFSNSLEKYPQSSADTTSKAIKLYNPGAYFLSKCCSKLNIQYSPQSFAFWANVNVQAFSLSSRPSSTYPTSEAMYHGFSCLSLYLSGTENNAAIVREMINRYLYENFKAMGKCMGHDFSKMTHESPIIREALWSFSITEVHLLCLAQLFDCRIAIYGDRQWKRYGNWDEEDSAIPAFLMEFKDDKYSPILSLV